MTSAYNTSLEYLRMHVNLVILVQICDELSRGQAGFPRILNQNGQNDLESQGQ